MESPPLALSVHHFISSVGADAGFAAFIAVAILVLLYFAQARETATLRRRADDAGLRVQELEGQIAELNAQVAALPAEISVSRAGGARVAAGVPGRVPAGVPGVATDAGAGAVWLPPAAPAGMAAPALAAATRLIPDPDPLVGEAEPATAAGGANGDGHRPVPAPAAAAAPAVQRAVPAGVAAVGATRGAVGAPVRTGVPGQGRPPGAGGPGRAAGAAGYGRPQGAGQARPGGPARPQAMPARPRARRSRSRLVLGVLVAALALAAVAVGVIALTSGGSSSSASRSASAALASHRTRPPSTVVPSSVTVSVLNGTDLVGLAGRVSKRLTTDGYRAGRVTNASDQTHATTLVEYTAPTYRSDAVAVATALKLGQAAVQPIDVNTKPIACPPPQACTAPVVVTVGRDLVGQ